MLTGITGTLAPFIKEYLESINVEVIVWDTDKLSINDKEGLRAFVNQTRPDYFFQIATGPEYWLESIIDVIKDYEIKLLFTSTESVFSETNVGPFKTTDLRDADNDYGHYKISCEDIITKSYKDNSYICRLGWQIGLVPEKNNMLTFIKDNRKNLEASDNWILSTSFMPDTAKALFKVVTTEQPGTYHIDGNTEELSFYQLTTKLNDKFNLGASIKKVKEPIRNNKLFSNVQYVDSIMTRLNQK